MVTNFLKDVNKKKMLKRKKCNFFVKPKKEQSFKCPEAFAGNIYIYKLEYIHKQISSLTGHDMISASGI